MTEMAEESGVNPEPPPEASHQQSVLRSDAIGDTMYSERGVLRILINLNRAVPRYLPDGAGEAGPQGSGTEQSSHKASGDDGQASSGAESHVSDPCDPSRSGDCRASRERQSPGPRSGDVPSDGAEPAALMELEEELEQQLCQLWDMTAERDVAAFLHSAGLLPVVWPLLGSSHCPRLLEILAGTLANCVSHAGAFPMSPQLVVETAELLLDNSRDDAPLLAETLRLVTAGVCGGSAAPLHAAVARWLPLLRRLLAAALSAPLLWRTLELVAAVTAPADTRQRWLLRLDAVDGWTAAMLEGLRQLVISPGEVTATDQLTICRDTLRLTSELSQPVPAQVALVSVRAVARGCGWDACVAGYLLWLVTGALQQQFSAAALADVLTFCSGSLAGRDAAAPDRSGSDWSARVPAAPGEATPGQVACNGGQHPAPDTLPEEEEELQSQLAATVVHLARTCDAIPHFVASVEPAVARFFLSELQRHAPELARTVTRTDDNCGGAKSPTPQ